MILFYYFTNEVCMQFALNTYIQLTFDFVFKTECDDTGRILELLEIGLLLSLVGLVYYL